MKTITEFPYRIKRIIVILVGQFKLLLLLGRYNLLPKLQADSPYGAERERTLGGDSVLEFVNGLFSADFNRKGLCVAGDAAVQGHLIGREELA